MGVLGVNHLALRTPDAEGLREFYAELTGAEQLEGAHGPLRLGQTVLVFFPAEASGAAADPDEIAFDVDAQGFGEVLARAERLGVLARPPVEHSPSSRGFLVHDPDGRRIEFVYEDRGVSWRGP